MAQPLRGIAWNALSAGVDISGTKITTLYATRAPGATRSAGAPTWWRSRAAMPPSRPRPSPVNEPSTLVGGVRDGVGAPATGTP